MNEITQMFKNSIFAKNNGKTATVVFVNGDSAQYSYNVAIEVANECAGLAIDDVTGEIINI